MTEREICASCDAGLPYACTCPQEPEITAELVAERYGIRHAAAENIAAYAALRAAGDMPWDAREKLDISEPTKVKYEKYMTALRAELGLPELPKRRGGIPFASPARVTAAGVSGGHQRNHVQQGVTSPDCPLCSPPDLAREPGADRLLADLKNSEEPPASPAEGPTSPESTSTGDH